MTPFTATADGATALIEPVEAALLTQLVAQIRTLLDSTANPESTASTDQTPDIPRDAALLRLLPDAYPGDREASAEFRRFTAAGLADKKLRNATVVADDLAEATASEIPVRLTLTSDSVQAWMRSLTDVRLVLATRLGIQADDDGLDADAGPEERMLTDVYDWLGWVQGSLVDTLDADGAFGRSS